MPFIPVNGLTYFYREQGAGSPLVLLHGFTGSSDNWLDIADQFADQYHVLLLDLPGHGRTGSPPNPARYAMDLVARDLVAILKTMGVQNGNLLGYSMGGRLALYLAVKYPACFKSLILESTSPGLDSVEQRQRRTELDNELADDIEAIGIEAFVRRWQELPLFASQKRLSSQQSERQYLQRLKNSTLGLANSLRGMGTGQQPSLWPELGSTKIPTLLLAGELDWKFADIAKLMAASMPIAELKLFADTGHNIHLEQALRFSTAVMAFLTNLEQLPQAEQEDKKERGQ